MKILMVSSYLPYPLLDGGRIRLYNLLKRLGKDHEITLVCEKWGGQTQKDIDEISKICKKVIVVDRPKALSAKNVAKSLLSVNPLLTIVHTNNKITKLIKEQLASNRFDLVHVETFYIMQNLPRVNIPVVLAEHNIEYLVYERYARKSNIFFKPVYYWDIAKLKRVEKNAWEKADRLIAVSKPEQKIMGSRAEVVPNGVDLKKFWAKKKFLEKEEKLVLFIGSFKWIQNRDAIAYILNNIWPKISTQGGKNLRLWVVGKNIPDSLKILRNKDVIYDENATLATEEIFQKADLLLAPIRAGGGTSYKILESMASGTPVLTTPLGNEGIGAKNGSEILIADNPDDFARLAVNVLSDLYLYEKISRNGRKFIEENYDWDKIALKLEKIYQDILKK